MVHKLTNINRNLTVKNMCDRFAFLKLIELIAILVSYTIISSHISCEMNIEHC